MGGAGVDSAGVAGVGADKPARGDEDSDGGGAGILVVVGSGVRSRMVGV
jgi:hypothetical protein